MKWSNWQWLFFVVLVIFDQLSKVWAQQAQLVVFNQGISFGFLAVVPTLWLTLILLATAGLFAWWWSKTWPTASWAGVFFWAGAAGNLVDRLLFSAVRDWLPIPFLIGSKNNLADWFITVGVLLLLWQFRLDAKARQDDNKPHS